MTGEPTERAKAALAEIPLDKLADIEAECVDIIGECSVGLSLLPRGDDADFRELLRRKSKEAWEVKSLVRWEVDRRRDARARGLES